MSKVGQFQRAMPFKVGQFQPKGDSIGKIGGKKYGGWEASQASRLAMLKNRFKKHGEDDDDSKNAPPEEESS